MGVRIVITSAGSPDRYTSRLKENGIKVMHVVPNPRFAKKAEDAGVDAVIAEGIEGGGHKSTDEITTMCLVPQVVDTVKLPVVAAGGFWDARTFLAARFLGADGIQMGTRFIMTEECSVHPSFKRFLLTLKDNDTLLIGRQIKRVIRVAKNKLVEKINESKETELPDLMGPHRSMFAIKNGDIENGLVMTGQVAGCIKDIKPVAEVIREIVEGARILFSSYS